MKKKEWPELIGFERAGALLRRKETRGKETIVLCRVFPSDTEFEYPSDQKLPFAVVKERKFRPATLLFTEDGTAWFMPHTPNQSQFGGLRSHGCLVLYDVRRTFLRQ